MSRPSPEEIYDFLRDRHGAIQRRPTAAQPGRCLEGRIAVALLAATLAYWRGIPSHLGLKKDRLASSKIVMCPGTNGTD